LQPKKLLTAEGDAAPVRTKTRETLHKTPLPGVVLPQRVRCGRPNCRCARGELHGPYFYRFWREGGRQRRQYVRRSELEEVRARCEARRRERKRRDAGLQLWRQMAALLREVEQA
jgi:Family of unknown function (DUF6788)